MARIEIRNQKVSDAKRFYEILNNPNFIYFGVSLKNVEAEKEFLKLNTKKRKENIEHNYAVLYNKKIIGGIGIKIDRSRPFIGEIGYFIDEKYWGKGIATKAVRLIEKIAFKKLKLKRIEIRMNIKNKASEKVAIKAGYKKEGILKKAFMNEKKKLVNNYLYAKTV